MSSQSFARVRLSGSRACAALIFLLLTGALAQTVLGQVPQGIIVLKLDEYSQNSSDIVTPGPSDFSGQALFSVAPNQNAQVTLRGPTGSVLSLLRQTDGSYAAFQAFPNRSALNAAFPDGQYLLSVTSGPSITFAVVSGQAVPPTSITNYAALQSSPNNQPTIHWNAIPDAQDDDFILLDIATPDGTPVLTADALPPQGTVDYATSLPLGVPLTADLTYAKLHWGTDNTGNVQVASGSGFNLEFSIYCPTTPPVIVTQPIGSAVIGGASISLSVNVTGILLSYQWEKDGVPIPGATSSTYAVSSVLASQAGTYSVAVTNPAGTVRSSTAVIAVGPALLVSTYAGSPNFAWADVDGPAGSARFANPAGLAVDRTGNLYVADRNNQVIRKIGTDGLVSTIAGQPGQPGYADGAGNSARFNFPCGLALDGSGNLYVADSFNDLIRKITPGGTVTTLAGKAGVPGSSDGPGTDARFNIPQGLAIDSFGNLYVADGSNNLIRKITPGGTVTTLAGSLNSSTAKDGFGADARFADPNCIAADPGGTLYVGDVIGYELRKITPAGLVSAAAGNLSVGYGVRDGVTGYALVGRPLAIAVDPAGSVYFADGGVIRRLGTDGAVQTVAGQISNGFADGLGAAAVFGGALGGMAVDASGAIYISDDGTNVIRKCVPVAGGSVPGVTITAQPRLQTMAIGSSLILSASVNGLSTYFAWLKDGVPIPGATGQSLVLTGASSDAGTYTFTTGDGAGSAISAPAVVNFVSTLNPGRLVNLSVLSNIQGSLGMGFVIGGSGVTGSQSILARGIGPSIGSGTVFNVPGVIPDPVLSITQQSNQSVIATNAGWGLNQAAVMTADNATGAFPLTNPLSLDSATVAGLLPVTGGYTATIRGQTNDNGYVLAEVYDNTANYSLASPRLVNLSCLTQIAKSGELDVGFVIGGSTSKTVLVRAGGPVLGQLFSVSGAMPNPQLRVSSLGDSSTSLAFNAGWGASQTLASAAQKVGAFPFPNSSSDLDSAALLTLPPGPYTVQVKSTTGLSGTVLVEVYEVP